jgi:hypothetical protein
LRYPPEILKTVDAGAVTVAPTRLNRVATDNFETSELKAVIGVAHVWSQNVSENIGLATTGRAWTRPPEKLEIKIRLGSVVPLNGELTTNLLNVARFQAHGV